MSGSFTFSDWVRDPFSPRDSHSNSADYSGPHYKYRVANCTTCDQTWLDTHSRGKWQFYYSGLPEQTFLLGCCEEKLLPFFPLNALEGGLFRDAKWVCSCWGLLLYLQMPWPIWRGNCFHTKGHRVQPEEMTWSSRRPELINLAHTETCCSIVTAHHIRYVLLLLFLGMIKWFYNMMGVYS